MATASKAPRSYRYYGVNRHMQNQIGKLAEAGQTVETISERLNVHPDCVKNFMPKVEKPEKAPAKKAPPRKKAGGKKVAEEPPEAESWEG